MSWYLKVLKNYFNFKGRARRKEYWMFALFNFIFAMLPSIAATFVADFSQEAAMGLSILGLVYAVLVIIPGIAVGVRRLHDTGRTGWWMLIAFIPLVGAIVLIVFFVFDSQPGDNKYGPNPKLLAA